ncbi:unannotated protein [freshwater metagenome]|uniref:Unannotated protein n=1 Tax=freshwater metagenome TaxID=449393 RepID=A0A6J6QZT5_9ZZZZ
MHHVFGWLPHRRAKQPRRTGALPRRRHRPSQLGLAVRQGPLQLRISQFRQPRHNTSDQRRKRKFRCGLMVERSRCSLAHVAYRTCRFAAIGWHHRWRPRHQRRRVCMGRFCRRTRRRSARLPTCRRPSSRNLFVTASNHRRSWNRQNNRSAHARLERRTSCLVPSRA